MLTFTEELKRCLKQIQEATDKEKCAAFKKFQELVTLSTIAVDECDFGASIELGINLFCFGDPYFHKWAGFLLKTAYDLLERYEYSAIVEAHLKNRRKGPDLKF